jgi:hypothetical protein
MAAEAAEEVKAWLGETRILLRAAELLVEWFTDEGCEQDEYAAFKASLDLPYKNLELIDEWLRVRDSAPTRVSKWTARRFEASQGLARAISPLLERIVMYQPDFIVEARLEAQRAGGPIQFYRVAKVRMSADARGRCHVRCQVQLQGKLKLISLPDTDGSTDVLLHVTAAKALWALGVGTRRAEQPLRRPKVL